MPESGIVYANNEIDCNMNEYKIVDISEWRRADDEPMGGKPKFWVHDARETVWLFKRQSQGGDHWAEKLAAEIADLLTIPHASMELATYKNAPGVITKDFTDNGGLGTLILGNDLLLKADPTYPKHGRFRLTQHTVRRALGVLDQEFIKAPPILMEPRAFCRAPDVFVGYLMLDAIVGNTDRHHENWGVLKKNGGNSHPRMELAPSFDHAASLGQILTEREKKKRLETRDSRYTVKAYASRARSAIYGDEEDRKSLHTIDAFALAAEFRPAAGSYWLESLRNLDNEQIESLTRAAPEACMSEISKKFTIRMLQCNRKKILELNIP